MDDEHEEPGWLTPEEEEILDRIATKLAAERAKLPPEVRKAEHERLVISCAEARQYRIERAAAGNEEASRP